MRSTRETRKMLRYFLSISSGPGLRVAGPILVATCTRLPSRLQGRRGPDVHASRARRPAGRWTRELYVGATPASTSGPTSIRPTRGVAHWLAPAGPAASGRSGGGSLLRAVPGAAEGHEPDGDE